MTVFTLQMAWAGAQIDHFGNSKSSNHFEKRQGDFVMLAALRTQVVLHFEYHKSTKVIQAEGA
jgi:hypothetical protein